VVHVVWLLLGVFECGVVFCLVVFFGGGGVFLFSFLGFETEMEIK